MLIVVKLTLKMPVSSVQDYYYPRQITISLPWKLEFGAWSSVCKSENQDGLSLAFFFFFSTHIY